MGGFILFYASQLKKALDNATAKSAELSLTNRELRSRESLMQKESLQQKDIIRGLKAQLRCYMESKGATKEVKRIQVCFRMCKQQK